MVDTVNATPTAATRRASGHLVTFWAPVVVCLAGQPFRIGGGVSGAWSMPRRRSWTVEEHERMLAD
jgi:hypothetical protein